MPLKMSTFPERFIYGHKRLIYNPTAAMIEVCTLDFCLIYLSKGLPLDRGPFRPPLTLMELRRLKDFPRTRTMHSYYISASDSAQFPSLCLQNKEWHEKQPKRKKRATGILLLLFMSGKLSILLARLGPGQQERTAIGPKISNLWGQGENAEQWKYAWEKGGPKGMERQKHAMGLWASRISFVFMEGRRFRDTGPRTLNLTGRDPTLTALNADGIAA